MKIQTSLSYVGKIEELKGRNDPEAIKAVAKEMESVFAYEMIKAMRAAAEVSSKNSFGKDLYMSMFDMEIARLFAERGMGLQDMLLKGLNQARKTESSGQGIKGEESRIEDPELQTTNRKPFNLPVSGTISSNFGMRRHPVYGDYRFHHGIDIAAAEGSNIYPIRKGRVIFSGEQPGYGNVVVVDHGDGFFTKYGHNKVNLVKEGDAVDRETVIALVGSTGVATGPHLHFEVKYNGEHVNPMVVMAIEQ